MSHKPELCPACGEGHLHARLYVSSVEHRGTTGDIRQIKMQCDHCHADLYDDACGRTNRRNLVRFQKEVEGVPTGQQIRDLRRRLGLSSEAAGELLGGGPKAFSKYENEEIVPRGAMRTLIKYLLAHPERIGEILEANGKQAPRRTVVLKQVRGTVVDSEEPIPAIQSAWRTGFGGSAMAAEVFTDVDVLAMLHSQPIDLDLKLPSTFYSAHSSSTTSEKTEIAPKELVIEHWAMNRSA